MGSKRQTLFFIGLAIHSAACSRTLDGRDTLRVDASPTFLAVRDQEAQPCQAEMPMATACLPVQGGLLFSQCLSLGGSEIKVQGLRSDGTIPAGFAVDLVIQAGSATSAAGSVIPLGIPEGRADAGSSPDFPSKASAAPPVTTPRFDDAGLARFCLLPGTVPGTISLVARSGVIESKAVSVPVLANQLPTGSSLKLAASTQTFALRNDLIWDCNAPSPVSCSPNGAKRQAWVTATGKLPAQMTQIPKTAGLVLTTDFGGFASEKDPTRDPTCASASPQNPTTTLSLDLVTGQAKSALLCFGDAGGTANLTASSGSITTESPLAIAVAGIPHIIDLSSNVARVTPGSQITFTATVRGCDGNLLSGILVSQQGDGNLDLKSSVTLETNAQGQAVFDTNVRSGFMMGDTSLKVSVVGAPSMQCVRKVAVAN